MNRKISSRPSSSPQSPLLPGLKPGMRMKGGVRYDPEIKGFVAIVHTWNNVACLGEPQEWRSPEVFQTEEAALSYYKAHIRPALEQFMAQWEKSGQGGRHRRLE